MISSDQWPTDSSDHAVASLDRACRLTPVGRFGAAVAWSLLVLLLVTNVPLFLCMPLTDDAAMYDLQALNWLHGGMLYRDILEPNLPGVIWLHAAVRWTLGTSSMALRAVDLLLFSTFVALSRNWLASSGATRATQAWSVLVLFVCYFSLSEWCHCQRDIWLLVLGLAGLTLRRRQIDVSVADLGRDAADLSHETRQRAAGGIAQRMLGLPRRPVLGRRRMAQADDRPAGGLLLDAQRAVRPQLAPIAGRSVRPGVGRLVDRRSGRRLAGLVRCVALFLATLVEWNPRYVAAAREQWTLARFAAMQVRFFPWQLLHLAAIPIALIAVGRRTKHGGRVETSKSRRNTSRRVEKSKSQKAGAATRRTRRPLDFSALRLFDFSTLFFRLFSLFYLAWLVQSYWLQHLFDYVHAPAMLLAIVLVAASFARRAAEQSRHPT